MFDRIYSSQPLLWGPKGRPDTHQVFPKYNVQLKVGLFFKIRELLLICISRRSLNSKRLGVVYFDQLSGAARKKLNFDFPVARIKNI